MSLCGGLTSDIPLREMQARFARHIVTWEQFSASPELTANPNLVVRMNGRYFSWQVIGPVLLAQAAFGHLLPDKACGLTLSLCIVISRCCREAGVDIHGAEGDEQLAVALVQARRCAHSGSHSAIARCC